MYDICQTECQQKSIHFPFLDMGHLYSVMLNNFYKISCFLKVLCIICIILFWLLGNILFKVMKGLWSLVFDFCRRFLSSYFPIALPIPLPTPCRGSGFLSSSTSTPSSLPTSISTNSSTFSPTTSPIISPMRWVAISLAL